MDRIASYHESDHVALTWSVAALVGTCETLHCSDNTSQFLHQCYGQSGKVKMLFSMLDYHTAKVQSGAEIGPHLRWSAGLDLHLQPLRPTTGLARCDIAHFCASSL